jgi:formate dehydrogenase assembly factor FdhD
MKPAPAYSKTAVRRVASGEEHVDFDDVLAIEEPLEIRLGFAKEGKFEHKAVSITMRTPGDDGELAAGFLFTEGIICDADQIKQIRHCGQVSEPGAIATGYSSRTTTNTIRVDLNVGVDVDLKSLERHFYTTSSCGVCGKATLEALCSQAGFAFVAPPQKLCTDNAAMIAWAGIERLRAGIAGENAADFVPRSRWPLDSISAPMVGSGQRHDRKTRG